MQETSDVYKRILTKGDYWVETRLVIGDGTDPEEGYDESWLCSMTTESGIFSEDTLSVGGCIASEINIVMRKPENDIPRNARLVPYVRITDGTNYSEWLQKGEFYIDTRQKVQDGTSLEKISIKGYDAMLKTEQGYGESSLEWPARAYEEVQEIAAAIGVEADEETIELLKSLYYRMQYPSGYTYREVLSHIAAIYGGGFIISDTGRLRLVALYNTPKETNLLITGTGETITVGGVRIRV